MSMGERIARLERGRRGGACPACAGWPAFVTVRGDAAGNARDPDPPPCGRCGRVPLVVVVCDFGDEDDDGGRA